MELFPRLSLPTTQHQPSMIARCGACGLYKHCRSPKMPVYGKGRRRILVVGEAPGLSEDERNQPFIGKAGQKLRMTLRRYGVDLDRDCWTTNSIRCRPANNRTPTVKELEHCRPFLLQALRDLRPIVVIALGGPAIHTIISHIWKRQTTEPEVGRWVGWQIPSQKINAWVCPTYHPSYVLRSESEPAGPVVNMYFHQHIKNACALTARPWKTVPDYQRRIVVEKSPTAAATFIREAFRDQQAIAFDVETNMLKSDSSLCELVCCSISNGRHTIAYPWVGKAIEATKELLENKHYPKIGWNIPMEHLWMRRNGIRVRRWSWDGMIATHVLDNRPGICSLKMQYLLQLGQPDYNSHIESMLTAPHGNAPNKIKDIDLDALLLYCGLDSLGEYKIGMKQMLEVKRAIRH